MFAIGLILLLIGAVLVYATIPISRAFGIITSKGVLTLKIAGFIIALLGVILLLFNEVPEGLQLLRNLEF